MIKIKKLFFCLAVLPLTTSLLPISLAQANSEQNCLSTIATAKQRLQGNRNLDMIARSSNLSQSWQDYPQGRPIEYLFLFKGLAAESIMTSGNLQQYLANQIIKDCSHISMVKFGIQNSGWVHTYGLMPNGKVQIFKCLEPAVGNKPKWGQIICT
jgi:hypothetical protein